MSTPKGWIPGVRFAAALLWALIPAAVTLIIIVPNIDDMDMRKALQTGAVTLLFGGFLGGMLKLLLDEVSAEKQRRQNAAMFVSNVLADLKAVYDQVARSRILIPAHKSVKTYGDEMRGLIDARVTLRNVVRALGPGADGVDDVARAHVAEQVKMMETYLSGLTGEFQKEYKKLSDQQRNYEAIAGAKIDAFVKNPVAGAPPDLPEFVWDSIRGLGVLADFVESGDSYKSRFEAPLDDASKLLRDELARIGGTGSL